MYLNRAAWNGADVTSYVVKAEVRDPLAKIFSFPRMKTMYGGKAIAEGDEVFVFASETEGGAGLIARGEVFKAAPANKPRDVARWTPRVSIEVKALARARRRLGREELKAFRGSTHGAAEAELDFKFYRQATNKIGGVSEEAARFLKTFF
jgi:hypothetical protein